MSSIQLLDQTLINQIAAGEVIERPFSVLKELIENSIDANATAIEVLIRGGGKVFLQVKDNGIGMTREDLELCIQRHATSKLNHADLFNIQTFGFRGEALPSIGSVSRLHIQTKRTNEPYGWQIEVEGGSVKPPIPCQINQGTCVTIRDLFFSTPARLNFLKTDQNEYLYCLTLIKRLALSYPTVSFQFQHNEKNILNYPSQNLESRITAILGHDFMSNSIRLQNELSALEVSLVGYISLPTYNKSSAQDQHIFVNQRPIKDKNLSALIKVAYQDVLGHGRHPAAVLFINLNPCDVDVNVHPAKLEVRFRYQQELKSFIIKSLQQAIQSHSRVASQHIAQAAFKNFKSYPETASAPSNVIKPTWSFSSSKPIKTFSPLPSELSSQNAVKAEHISFPSIDTENVGYLGYAKAQIGLTYIIAESANDLIIIDQHAAHERIIYEELKNIYKQKNPTSQRLVLPEVISLSIEQLDVFKECYAYLVNVGFECESFGVNAIQLNCVPTCIVGCDYKTILIDFLDEFFKLEEKNSFEEKIMEKMSSQACRFSIRAGRQLSLQEMNALLRQMEQTNNSAQCNHGRPTYIRLSKKEIEALFERR